MAKLTPAHQAIVEAIVRLHFNEPDKALEVLYDALNDCNYELMKEIAHGNRANA